MLARCKPSVTRQQSPHVIVLAMHAGLARSDSPPSQAHDLYLDWLRWTAAVLVLVSHVRGGFFVKWSDLDPAFQTHLNYALFFLTRLGREAVIVFFVLSGFFVGGQAFTDYRTGRYVFRRYMVARVARLYTVLLPALLLTALLDSLHPIKIGAGNSWQSLLTNLFFLQGIFGVAYGSNGPLWSLSFEWWFYVLFGLLMQGAATGKNWRTAVSAALIAAVATILWLQNKTILWMFFLWLLGVIARTTPAMRRTRGTAVCTALVAFLGVISLSNTRQSAQGDCLVAMATAMLIYVTRGLSPLHASWFSVGKTLASFSFTLYAVHYPLNYLLESVLVPIRTGTADAASWITIAVLAMGEIFVCYLIYLLFERQTPAIRKWLQSILSRTHERAEAGSIANSIELPPPKPAGATSFGKT